MGAPHGSHYTTFTGFLRNLQSHAFLFKNHRIRSHVTNFKTPQPLAAWTLKIYAFSVVFLEYSSWGSIHFCQIGLKSEGNGSEQRYYIGFSGYLTVLIASVFYYIFIRCGFVLKIELSCKFTAEFFNPRWIRWKFHSTL